MRNEKLRPGLPPDGAVVALFRPDRNRNPQLWNRPSSSISSPDALATWLLVSFGRKREPLSQFLSSVAWSSSCEEENEEEEEEEEKKMEADSKLSL